MKRFTFFHLNLLALVVFAIVALFAVTTAKGAGKPAGLVICEVWGDRLCGPAQRVAWCESRFNPHARNGQYWGLYQVSSHWRRTVPGWGWTLEAQARHALRVYRRTGSTWRHWRCRP